MLLKNFYKKMSGALAVAVVLVGFGGAVLIPVGVSAAPVNVLEQCDTSTATSDVCKNRTKDENLLPALLKNIINLLLTVIGIISVIMIIIGGIRYTTSGGDGGQTKSARDTIVYAVVGLVIAIMSFAIVNFVLVNL